MKFKKIADNLKIGDTILIRGRAYKILTHIVWRQGIAQVSYNKYVLEDEDGNSGYRFFVSDDYEYAGIGEVFEHPFEEPMPEELVYEGKKYKLVQDEFCVAELVEGEDYYKVGSAEIWWDYESVNDSGKGLSLGRDWKSWEREDLLTTSIDIEEVEIVKR